MLKKVLPSLLGLFIFCYIISSIAVGAIFSTVGDPAEEVQQVEPVSTQFDTLDERVFNDGSLNPTELIKIKQSDGGSVFSIGEEGDTDEPVDPESEGA